MEPRVRITVRVASDTMEEQSLIVNKKCDIAVSDRGNEVYVSTREDSHQFSSLPGWRVLPTGDARHIKRFLVKQPFNRMVEQLRKIYPDGAVHIMT